MSSKIKKHGGQEISFNSDLGAFTEQNSTWDQWGARIKCLVSAIDTQITWWLRWRNWVKWPSEGRENTGNGEELPFSVRIVFTLWAKVFLKSRLSIKGVWKRLSDQPFVRVGIAVSEPHWTLVLAPSWWAQGKRNHQDAGIIILGEGIRLHKSIWLIKQKPRKVLWFPRHIRGHPKVENPVRNSK